jgi:uncharacterized protein
VLLMDHTPLDFRDAAECAVDFQCSGHTHHGQLFPMNLFTGLIYDRSWGRAARGKTVYYVSCGVGSWGPPARIGSFSEIVHIRFRFTGAR